MSKYDPYINELTDWDGKNLDTISNRLKYISSINDLPLPVGWVITLPSTWMQYFFLNIVDLQGNEIVFWENVFRANSQEEWWIANATITINDTCTISDFRFNNCQMTIDSIWWAFDRNRINFYDSANCLTVLNADNIVMETVWFINSYWFVIDWTLASLILSPNCIFRSVTTDSVTFFELTENAHITRRIRIQDSVFQTNLSGQNSIKVSPLASIWLESFILNTVRFVWPWTTLNWINWDIDIANFTNNSWTWVINSTAIANMYMKNNAVETVVSVIWARYAMAWVTEINTVRQKFTHILANNSLRYDSSIARIFRIQCTFTILWWNNRILWVYIWVKRWVSIDPTADRLPESEVYITTSWTRPDVWAVQCITTLNQNDEVYLIVQNTGGTENITIQFMNMIVERATT